jgi:hypothetical protein
MDDVATRRAYVYVAELDLAPGADPRAPGGAVTMALCGHWDHEGPCRWPHSSELDADVAPARLRTVFTCRANEVNDVHRAIDDAVRGADAWSVRTSERRDPRGDEVTLGERLARSDD